MNIGNDGFFKKVVDHYGYNHQLNKLKEELFELGAAICHWQDKKVSDEDLVSELTDCMILIGQIFSTKEGYNDLFEDFWNSKIKRLSERTGISLTAE